MSEDKPLQIPQYGSASITCPKQYVDYIIKKKEIELPPIPEYCFIIYSASLIEKILQNYPHKMIDIGSRNPTKIYFCNPGVQDGFAIIGEQLGASMSAVVLEELIALGFSRFIATGTTGYPCRDREQMMNIGDLILVDEALIYEGTSPHYKPDMSVSAAHPGLCDLCESIIETLDVRFYRGRIATTDALYRETAGFLDEIIARNALAVDMETSALYTVAAYHRKEICAVLYISDIVKIDHEWNTSIMSDHMDVSESVFMEFIVRLVGNGKQ